MPRIRNEEEFRIKKQQILTNAISLLAEIGYEQFSINKVIECSGMTKGAFFHYYKSKKELIEGIIIAMLEPMLKEFNRIADEDITDSKEKIRLMFNAASKMKASENVLMTQLANFLYKEENQELLHLMMADILKASLHIFEKVIAEGNEKGQFQIAYPHGTAFMLLNTTISLNVEIGKTMLIDETTPDRCRQLYEKLMSFELYNKELFGFENQINLYGTELIEKIKILSSL